MESRMDSPAIGHGSVPGDGLTSWGRGLGFSPSPQARPLPACRAVPGCLSFPVCRVGRKERQEGLVSAGPLRAKDKVCSVVWDQQLLLFYDNHLGAPLALACPATPGGRASFLISHWTRTWDPERWLVWYLSASKWIQSGIQVQVCKYARVYIPYLINYLFFLLLLFSF